MTGGRSGSLPSAPAQLVADGELIAVHRGQIHDVRRDGLWRSARDGKPVRVSPGPRGPAGLVPGWPHRRRDAFQQLATASGCRGGNLYVVSRDGTRRAHSSIARRSPSHSRPGRPTGAGSHGSRPRVRRATSRDLLPKLVARLERVGGAAARIATFAARGSRRRALATTLTGAALGRQPDRAAHARAAEAAVAVRVLREVLLVVVLGVVERARLGDLGRDLAVARRA